MESLLDFVCRIESRLKSLGFEFEFQSPDSGSRYYFKAVRYYRWDDGTYHETSGALLRVRVSDHYVPNDSDDCPRGNWQFELLQDEIEESIESTFESLSCYHWDIPQ